MLAEELPDALSDELAPLLKPEVAGVEEVQLGLGEVAERGGSDHKSASDNAKR